MNKINKITNTHPKLMEMVRFGITGTVSTITNYLVYRLLLKWFNPSVAFSIGYIAAFVVNYIMTTSFTFKVKATTKNGAGFIVSNIINYALCIAVLNFFIWLGIAEKWAPLPMYCITIPTNFLIVRFVMKK